MSTTAVKYRIILAADVQDGDRWMNELISKGESPLMLTVQTTRSAPPRGRKVTRIYVTPAAKSAAGYHQTIAELRMSMARTRGGDTHGPVFLREDV